MLKITSWFQNPTKNFIKNYNPKDKNRSVIYDLILQDIKQNVDFNSANLQLLNYSSKKLENAAQFGNNCNLIRAMNFKMGSGLSAWLAQKKRFVCLPDIHRGARHVHNPIRSFLALPILHQDTVIGVLNLAHIKPNAFGPRQVKTLQNLMKYLAPQLHDIIITIPNGEHLN